MTPSKDSNTRINQILVISILLSFAVILLGAYTRLSDAGLGCPDWPGCYGQIIAPSSDSTITVANATFPSSPVDIQKARTEMHHRYLAGSLGCLVLGFWFFSFLKRKSIALPMWLPTLLVILVIAQALLGMWTVTLRLLPGIVLSHLLGGFGTLSILWLSWLFLNEKKKKIIVSSSTLIWLALSTLVLVIIQILLGGWTSANYAALICPDFPQCNQHGWGNFSFRALHFFGGFGESEPLNYMDSAARVTIHMMHRFGAFMVALLGALLSFCLWQQGGYLKQFSMGVTSLLLLQIGLGVSNVLFYLPAPVAILHNAVAAILLLILIALNFTLIRARAPHG